METPKITGYRVVVLGSTCCEKPIEFADTFGRCHEIACECGHKHKTAGAAEKCREKLLGFDKKTKTCSAKWYNSAVQPIFQGYESTHLVIQYK